MGSTIYGADHQALLDGQAREAIERGGKCLARTVHACVSPAPSRRRTLIFVEFHQRV